MSKAGWEGNRELQALVRAVDGGAAFHPEVVQVEAAHVKALKSEWNVGTVSGGSVSYPNAGGVRLAATSTTVIARTTNNGTNATDLTHLAPFDAVVVEWLDNGAVDREIHNLVARLDPRRDGGQPKTVSEFRAQLFRVHELLEVEDGLDVWGLLPISTEVVVAASGEVAADFTFNFQGVGGRYPVVGPPPIGFGPLARPKTVIRIIALRSDGTVADNVTWLSDSVTGASKTDGSSYTATHYSVLSGADFGQEYEGGNVYRFTSTVASYPEFELNRASYTAATVTFSGSGKEVPNLTGTGSLVIAARGETPSDSSITFQIWTGSTWVTCFDGDIVGQDNTSQGGGDLSGVSTTGPWDVRVTLTPSSAASLNTPTAREFGIERTISTWLTGAATLFGGHRQVEPVTLKGNIAAAELVIAKTGEPDFRDYGSAILTSNHIGQIHVRLWLSATVRDDLNRSKWLLHSVWDVDDYTSSETHHRIMLVSPLRRLRNFIIPPFVVTSGNDGERIAQRISDTLKGAYNEIVDTMVAIPGRLRGPGIEDTTNTVAKVLRRHDAKDELDRLAYLDGSAVIESQGRIRTVKMMRDGPGGDTPVAFFPLGSYEAGDIGPGYSTRTDEFFVRYNWNDNNESFEDERRYLNAVALNKLGGVGITTTQQLDDETCKWISTQALADAVGDRVPHHFATGLMVWPIRSHYRHPELEPGDPVAIETTRFVGRSPLNDQGVRGRVGALAIVVAVRDPWGTELDLWVPSFEKIVPAEGAVTPFPFPTHTGAVLHLDGTERSHTGDTAVTTLATITVPPLFSPSRSIRAKGIFGSTGAGGTKTIRIYYAGVGGWSLTLPTGDQAETFEVIFTATSGIALRTTLVQPVQTWPTVFLNSPVDVLDWQAVTFQVQLANAGDTAKLFFSEVTWLGDAR